MQFNHRVLERYYYFSFLTTIILIKLLLADVPLLVGGFLVLSIEGFLRLKFIILMYRSGSL